jgi:hypothetical protein
VPEAVFCILMTYCRLGGYPGRHMVCEVSGYAYKVVERVEPAMVRAGFLGSAGWGNGSRRSITEKGKIALAIEVGRRRRGSRPSMSEREFQRRYGPPCLRRST